MEGRAIRVGDKEGNILYYEPEDISRILNMNGCNGRIKAAL
jgi:hypothetical protein